MITYQTVAAASGLLFVLGYGIALVLDERPGAERISSVLWGLSLTGVLGAFASLGGLFVHGEVIASDRMESLVVVGPTDSDQAHRQAVADAVRGCLGPQVGKRIHPFATAKETGLALASAEVECVGRVASENVLLAPESAARVIEAARSIGLRT